MSWIHRVLQTVLCLIVASVSASCSYMGGDLPAIYDVTKKLWMGGNNVTLQEASSVPYASIGVRLGHNNQIMLILASNGNDVNLWTSDAHIAISTRSGRIVRTAGLGRDLTDMSYELQTAANTSTIIWRADFKDISRYSVSGTCRRGPAKDEIISILDHPIHTQRIEELCTTDTHQIRWSYKNIFWIDPITGLAWRSVQHVHPNLRPIEIVVLRPPS